MQYIDTDMNNNQAMPIFMVVYVLSNKGPYFSPHLEYNYNPNFSELINSLLKDMIEVSSCMERIAVNYPPYNVSFIYNN